MKQIPFRVFLASALLVVAGRVPALPIVAIDLDTRTPGIQTSLALTAGTPISAAVVAWEPSLISFPILGVTVEVVSGVPGTVALGPVALSGSFAGTSAAPLPVPVNPFAGGAAVPTGAALIPSQPPGPGGLGTVSYLDGTTPPPPPAPGFLEFDPAPTPTGPGPTAFDSLITFSATAGATGTSILSLPILALVGAPPVIAFTASVTVPPPTAGSDVPEPATALLLGAGLAGFGAVRRCRKRRRGLLSAVAAAVLVVGSWSGLARAAVDPEVADFNDDGAVNIFDYLRLLGAYGKQAGQEGFLEGLDIVPDSVINITDIMAFISQFGSFGASTGPTMLAGHVFDGAGNPLEGIRVQVGTSTVEGCTDRFGFYALSIGPEDTGATAVTFDGSGGARCAPVDPSPGRLSGQYPTIPNEPVFINGGTVSIFRDVSLPERDLTNAVDLRDPGVATEGSPGTWTLDEDVEYMNAGVKMTIPAGCSATFPPGEDPVLSITRVDPAMLPVPMPPGLSSTLFVTYQPGGTEINCPPGRMPFTEFDNSDGFANGPGSLPPGPGPFLAGVTNGVFTPLAACAVSGAAEGPAGVFTGGTLRCGPIRTPFDFAWYHADIRPPVPCPRTTVVGTVRRNDGPMTPVPAATVSVPGVGPVTTDAGGEFRIPQVAAGPNGGRCLSNPFTLRASASSEGDLGVSALTLAVPGADTDVGDIKLGIAGTVQGRALALSSISPFVVVPLVDGVRVDSLFGPNQANVRLQPAASGSRSEPTGPSGEYDLFDVTGPYQVCAEFHGVLPVPGGGTAERFFNRCRNGDIDFTGKIEVKDFRFTSAGAVRVTVRDPGGNPVPDADVELSSPETPVGGGFVSPDAQCFARTDESGAAALDGFACFTHAEESFDGVPMGPCMVTVRDFNTGLTGRAGPGDGCFINRHGERVELIVDASVPGDVVQVRVGQGSQDGADKIVLNVDFAKNLTAPLDGGDFVVDPFFEVFLTIELDTDRQPETGTPSEIGDLVPDDPSLAGPTDLGVDLRISCQISSFGGSTCDLEDGAGNPVLSGFDEPGIAAGPNGDSSSVVILIPKERFLDAAGGPGTYDMSLLSEFQDFGTEFEGPFGGGNADVVPNGGSVAVSSEATGRGLDDPRGDTFSLFVF